jgi:tRNA A37 methylthiotransferase MiaB
VEVLVEQVTRKRGEAADGELGGSLEVSAVPELAGSAGEGSVALAGRTRHNKLVHFAGDPGLVGRSVTVRIDHAGPFALRGRAIEPGRVVEPGRAAHPVA